MNRCYCVDNQSRGCGNSGVWESFMVWKHNGKITDKPKPMPKVWDKICDDPTDPHSKLGIEALEEIFIPMKMKGSTCGIIMRLPTYDDIHEYQHILLSDEFDWNPLNNLFEIYSMEDEYRKSSNFHRSINIVESIIPSALPNINCRYESGILDLDREIAKFSIRITQDLIVDRLIINVRDRRKRSGHLIHIDKGHHSYKR